jgi:hypothetical protein
MPGLPLDPIPLLIALTAIAGLALYAWGRWLSARAPSDRGDEGEE